MRRKPWRPGTAYCVAGWRTSGVAWLRVAGYGIAVHAPWSLPLFSERHGMRRMLRVGGGWRIEWLRTCEPRRLGEAA